MANITTGGDFQFGTTGDDAVTLEAMLDLNPAAPDTLDGNGGSDTLSLTMNALADLLAGANLQLEFDGTDTWTIDGDTTGNDAVTLVDFVSVAFNDGATLVGGTTSEGVLDPAAGDVVGGGAVDLDILAGFAWDGMELTSTPFDTTSVISVDGQLIADVGTNFTNSQGAFELQAGDQLFFTANSAALAAQGNVGGGASFSFDVVISDGTDEETVSATFEGEIPFTNGNDTFVASDGQKDVNEQVDFGGEDEGDDTFTGDDQDNLLQANLGDDTLLGGNGNDTLEGGVGDDFLRGGNGDDRLEAGSSLVDGDTGNNLGGGAGDDEIIGGDGDDTLFGGVGDDSTGGLNGGNGDDVINGGAGDDLLNGEGDNDVLRGGDGDDTLNGGLGVDELRGGAGDDEVNGDDGNDLIFTSLGDDILTGGGDEDTFVLKTNAGNTTITDFDQDGDDKLDVSGLGITDLAGVLAIAYQVDGSAFIEIDSDTTVELQNADLASLSASDFDFA